MTWLTYSKVAFRIFPDSTNISEYFWRHSTEITSKALSIVSNMEHFMSHRAFVFCTFWFSTCHTISLITLSADGSTECLRTLETLTNFHLGYSGHPKLEHVRMATLIVEFVVVGCLQLRWRFMAACGMVQEVHRIDRGTHVTVRAPEFNREGRTWSEDPFLCAFFGTYIRICFPLWGTSSTIGGLAALALYGDQYNI
jgi:hypothetical protein